MSDKIIVKNLYKIYGPEPEEALRRMKHGEEQSAVQESTRCVVAVNDVSFTVGSGEIFVVMGLSGSGKSTLVRCINRLIDSTAGEITIDGQDVIGADDKTLRELRLNKIAMVFQHFALLPHRTVAENVEYGLKIKGIAPDERREYAREALETVGLGDWGDSPPGNLSGGMRQRVGLARALATDAEVLLMDEPFSALDPLIRADMQRQLLDLQDKLQKTIIFISHDLHEALLLGDKIAIMRDGRFVQVGSPENIVGQPADDYVAAFTHDVDRGRVFTVATVMRKAEPLQLGKENLSAAIERMRTNGRTALHVVDGEDGKPAGVLSLTDALAGRDEQKDVKALLRADYPTARGDERLIDIYDRCSEGLPLAVLGEDGRLEGVVWPRDVMAELGRHDK